jgi:hypothetical protein
MSFQKFNWIKAYLKLEKTRNRFYFAIKRPSFLSSKLYKMQKIKIYLRISNNKINSHWITKKKIENTSAEIA